MSREVKVRRRVTTPFIIDEMKGKEQVCYFEPSDEISLDVKKVLLTEGFHPIGFRRFEDLMDNAIKQPPRLFYISVTSDLGVTPIKEIKAHPKLADTFVLAAGVTKSHETSAYEAGADIYLPKPYMWRILPFIVRTMIFIDSLRNAGSEDGVTEISLTFRPDPDTIAEVRF